VPPNAAIGMRMLPEQQAPTCRPCFFTRLVHTALLSAITCAGPGTCFSAAALHRVWQS
jgi:hypothetical protein